MELKRVVDMKKVLEHSNSENQITLTKLDSVEMRLQQMTDRYDSLAHDNKELVERVGVLNQHSSTILRQWFLKVNSFSPLTLHIQEIFCFSSLPLTSTSLPDLGLASKRVKVVFTVTLGLFYHL